MQAVCLYFIKKYKDDMVKFAPTFMKMLVDENILSKEFVIKWFDKTIKLDKDSGLYDKKSERKFRELIEQFIEWLKNQESDSDSGSDSSEEEPKPASSKKVEEEEKFAEGEDGVESEAAIRQREMMEKQKKAQAAAFAKHQAKVQEQQIKEAEAAAVAESNRENRIDIKGLDNEEGDIDDI